MQALGVGIDALAVAVGQVLRARRLAVTFAAYFAIGASLLAAAAMVRVAQGANAETGRTLDLAGTALLARVATAPRARRAVAACAALAARCAVVDRGVRTGSVKIGVVYEIVPWKPAAGKQNDGRRCKKCCAE